MNRCAIDFGPRWRVLRALRWGLAACALVAGAGSAQRYLAYRAQADGWELARTGGEDDRPGALAPGPVDSLSGALRQAELARASLALPWPGLLADLETVAATDIALLGLRADGAAGTLNLEGEARDMAALHAYLAALGAGGCLVRVYLASRQNRQQAGKTAVSFVVQASWPAPGRCVAQATP